MSQRAKSILSIIVLLSITALAVWTIVSSDKDDTILVASGVRTVGKVTDKVKPYKGSKVLKYYFFVGSRKIRSTRSSNANYPTYVGDIRVVLYDPENPENNRILLHEPIDDRHLLEYYIGKPIDIHP